MLENYLLQAAMRCPSSACLALSLIWCRPELSCTSCSLMRMASTAAGVQSSCISCSTSAARLFSWQLA